MGAYCRLLLTLWDSDPMGEITGTHDYIQRLAGANNIEWARILGEIEMTKVLDIVTHPNENITVSSRRLIRERIAKESNKKRQQSFRERHKQDEEAPAVTKSNIPSSSSSSSSSSLKIKSKRELLTLRMDGETDNPTVQIPEHLKTKLERDIGEKLAWQCYDKLHLSKMANGYKCKSDYHAILKWVIGAVKKDEGYQKQTPGKVVAPAGKYAGVARKVEPEKPPN